jgi:hypothetical protein
VDNIILYRFCTDTVQDPGLHIFLMGAKDLGKLLFEAHGPVALDDFRLKEMNRYVRIDLYIQLAQCSIPKPGPVINAVPAGMFDLIPWRCFQFPKPNKESQIT